MTDVTKPLPGAAFGATVRLGADIPGDLPAMLDDAGGLLLLPGQHEISDRPDRLVDLSRAFGPEVEDYRFTLANPASVHASVPEIFIVSNLPPVSKMPPKRPEPPLTPDGRFPVQYPQRRGWHTDQSYRRPPPDVSLFYAVTPVARDRGQTLFASGILAYEALPAALKARVERLEGIHAQPGTGRSREAVLRGEAPKPCKPHERPQRQPVVRVHPTTGRRALYLCEWGQMDWVDGPFVGMEPGPSGDGAHLLDELMAHFTRPEFVYAHEWTQGDVLVWDNRCLVHAATWFDGVNERRVMWRTTVRGNPGAEYAGEKRSWIAEAAE
ncbi:MAG: TauD/TfdA family dioxygenase [Enhydrobacter sp.]|nr:MAG: TauD/TfdA family dioxygenase [Enhydrobacter sp.]